MGTKKNQRVQRPRAVNPMTRSMNRDESPASARVEFGKSGLDPSLHAHLPPMSGIIVYL